MKVVPFLIDNLASAIAGGTEFSAMKTLVADMEDKSMTGEEKKAATLKAFQAIGYGLAGWVVNLLLELAVAWARQQLK